MKKTNKLDLSHELGLPESHTVLDIDGVLCDFVSGFLNKAKEMGYGDLFPKTARHQKTWDFAVDKKIFTKVWNKVKTNSEFWLSLKPYRGVIKQITFKPLAYITHRFVDNSVTQEWLTFNKFPVPERCYTVAETKDKIILAKKLGAKRIIDDKPETCRQFIEAGLDAYLFTRPYNIYIDDLERISKLSEVNHKGVKIAA